MAFANPLAGTTTSDLAIAGARGITTGHGWVRMKTYAAADLVADVEFAEPYPSAMKTMDPGSVGYRLADHMGQATAETIEDEVVVIHEYFYFGNHPSRGLRTLGLPTVGTFPVLGVRVYWG